MEDTIADGIRARRQLSYAQWISFLIMMEIQAVRGLRIELGQSPIEYPVYQMTSVADGRRGSRTLRQSRRRPEVLETEAEQDEAIRATAEAELE